MIALKSFDNDIYTHFKLLHSGITLQMEGKDRYRKEIKQEKDVVILLFLSLFFFKAFNATVKWNEKDFFLLFGIFRTMHY